VFGLAPSARFCSATFGAGVVATQRPITCPKRQLQPKRYAQFFGKLTVKKLTNDIYSSILIFIKGERYV
jgi:hypothetical protein